MLAIWGFHATTYVFITIALATLYYSLTHHVGSAGVIFTTTPESRNISEGRIASFSCAIRDSGVFVSWHTVPPNIDIGTPVVSTPPGGGKLSVLSFTATAQHNNLSLICNAVKVPSSNQSTALLLVQGKLILLNCHYE